MTTILTSVVAGVLVLLPDNLPGGVGRISRLGAWNLLAGTAVPWPIVPMTLYLWAYWRFISGGWGAPIGAATRRAQPLPPSSCSGMYSMRHLHWRCSLPSSLLF